MEICHEHVDCLTLPLFNNVMDDEGFKNVAARSSCPVEGLHPKLLAMMSELPLHINADGCITSKLHMSRRYATIHVPIKLSTLELYGKVLYVQHFVNLHSLLTS